MGKKFIIKSLLGLFILILSSGITFAADEDTPATSDNPVQAAGMKGRCQNLPEGYPECADSPSECISDGCGRLPLNCLFLGEPIGGNTGYDLYKKTCQPKIEYTLCDSDIICTYSLWYGEALTPGEVGPVQAILTYEEGKELQGPFGLLYNYLALIYNYLSGIIIAVVIFIIIIAGVIIATSNGNQESFNTGKSMITKALVGMIVWFLASVILYAINPTFFNF